MRKFGLIAGEGELPAIIARNASQRGREVVVISLCEEIDPDIMNVADCIHRVAFDEVAQVAKVLRDEGVNEVAMIRKVWRKEACRPGVEEAEEIAHARQIC